MLNRNGFLSCSSLSRNNSVPAPNALHLGQAQRLSLVFMLLLRRDSVGAALRLRHFLFNFQQSLWRLLIPYFLSRMCAYHSIILSSVLLVHVEEHVEIRGCFVLKKVGTRKELYLF